MQEYACGFLFSLDRTRVLLIRKRRPAWQAGKLNGLGGKVEPGESFHDALVRELCEELGIAIAAATPWLCREFTYPHARVRLKFFRVTDWHGEIHPHEHTGATWTRLGETPAVTPAARRSALIRSINAPTITGNGGMALGASAIPVSGQASNPQ